MSSEKQLSKQPSNKGRVFFYRTEGDDHKPIQPDVMISNRKNGKLIYGTFFYRDLIPGNHSFNLTFTDDVPGSSIAHSQINEIKPVKINIKQNQQYFVKFTGFKGIFTDDDALKIMPADIAKNEIGLLFKL